MRRAGGGAIVNISSITGLSAAPNLVAYGSSKLRLRRLARTAAYSALESKSLAVLFRCSIIIVALLSLAINMRINSIIFKNESEAIPRKSISTPDVFQ
jgi:NAD(P)-dependent dehydrogenase (short-subunit alcohol dehydrogenase family)